VSLLRNGANERMLVKQRGGSNCAPKSMRHPWSRAADAVALIVDVGTTTSYSANTRSSRIVDVAWKMSSPLLEKKYGTSKNSASFKARCQTDEATVRHDSSPAIRDPQI
jgi:hypothetical protein